MFNIQGIHRKSNILFEKPLQEEKSSIEGVISDMKVKADQAERRNAEMRESEEKKHAEEIAFLKKTNSQLKVRKILLKLL